METSDWNTFLKEVEKGEFEILFNPSGDGLCLYSAVGYMLKLEPQEVKDRVFLYLHDHQYDVAGNSRLDFVCSLDIGGQVVPNSWGPTLELLKENYPNEMVIRTLPEVFQYKVVILTVYGANSANNKIEYMPKEVQCINGTLYLGHTGNHYVALKPKSLPWEGEDARAKAKPHGQVTDFWDDKGLTYGLEPDFRRKHSIHQQPCTEARSEIVCKLEVDTSEPLPGTSPSEDGPPNHTKLLKILRKKLEQKANNVDLSPNDPGSSFHSSKSFEDLTLSEQVCRGVYDMGFNKPTKVQERSLPMLLADPPNNMIISSQRETGKTAALVLSMLSRVETTKNFTQVICLLPTYERALQTGQVAENMGKFCREVKIGYAVRGEKVSRGQVVTDHILFGTPGTLLDWIFRHRVIDPKKIKMCALDAADVMITLQGHQDRCWRIFKMLHRVCQMLLTSTTYDDEVMKFAKTIVPYPRIIQLHREEEILDNIKQYYVMCRGKEDKFQALSNMYGVVSIERCIVFCRTREAASWLAQIMTQDGHAVALLSGEITVEQRIAVLNRFREGKEKLLITTNVCARGIDIEQVTVVVNYDMPIEPTGKPDFETYLHRIGRTGRFGKSGIAVNFIDGQRSMAIMKKIEEHFRKKILLLETDDIEALEKLT